MARLDERKYLDTTIDIIKSLPIGAFIDVTEASALEDTKQATDLILNLDGGQMAWRMRHIDYALGNEARGIRPYGYQWSVRQYCRGHKTEIDKLREGFARWYFFGYGDDDKKIPAYFIIDLDEVRARGVLEMKTIWTTPYNKDGTGGMYTDMANVAAHGCMAHTNVELEYTPAFI